ncbi:MAG: peptidoglycan DD-metalloendopeptidase family protein [Chitinophagaceae bacterium]|nr:peptidoglycan DD-metalloendopeptidase family protein [Chitinophagaceae bacterium]MCZ2397024.1 peptidoglycan DD-metalloendopeptidase family protein [Chitinophagales bacterium]
MLKKLFSLGLLFCVAFNTIAQDKATLESKRDQLRKEIEQTQALLNETQKSTKTNLNQLALIQRKVRLQENVVGSIQKEVRSLSDEIYLTQLEINRMNRVLDTLKDEYAQSMVYAYKNRGNYSFLNFIFSSENFNDAIKRIAYLKSYRNYQERQADNILKTQDLLNKKISELDQSKDRKSVVLKEQNVEMNKLARQRSEQAGVVKKLQGKQKELNKIIASKRKEDLKLKNTISAMIKREIELAKAEAARKAKAAAGAKASSSENSNTASNVKPLVGANESSNASAILPSTGSVLVNTEAEVALNKNFEGNRGKLPWPVKGYLLYHYGNNELPGGIKFTNYSVTIATKIGEPVKAVFDGEVTLVSYIEDNQAVYVKHGQYFTVYSNLTNVTVKRGDHVSLGQTLGRAGENDEGEGGRVEFLVLKETAFQNPESWLK